MFTADKDCRLNISLEGLEYLIYNNTYRYEHLEAILRKRENEDSNGMKRMRAI